MDYVKLLELKRALIDTDNLPSSINTYMGAIKSVCRESWRLGIISTEVYMRIQDVKRIKGNSTIRGRALSATELKKLVTVSDKDNSPKSVRDAAIVAIGYGCGLRRDEIVKLNVNDITGNKIVINGKGRYVRYVYLPKFAIKALNAWLVVRGDQDGALFVRVCRGGHVLSHRISNRTIGDIIKSRYTFVGVNHFSPHDLRRSFGTNLLNNGVDLSLVQKLMRHASINTTRIYDMRGEKEKERAVERLPF